MRRKGFTIVELLVASMLLGMLVTILTMIFNQSSISWRIGVAGVSDMDNMRDNMAELREEADNAFVYNDEVYRAVGLWDDSGNLRDRACDAPGSGVQGEGGGKYRATILRQGTNFSPSSPLKPSDIDPINVGASRGARSANNYTVNVMSGGPKNNVEDWQAIWSFPDDPSEWNR